MKKFVLAVLLLLAPGLSGAAGPQGDLMSARVNVNDNASLQRGANLFVNYCMSCHSAEFMRFGRVAQDLGLSEDLVEKYLIFTDAQIGDTMLNAMDPELSEGWFGAAPPDLSLTARVRSADWIYTFLNSFYRDEESAVGVNNLIFSDLSMPHPLWELQGMPEPVYEEVQVGDEARLEIVGTRVEEGSGLMTEAEYRQATQDLTNFMVYISEPIRAERERLGVRVILFLLVFLFVAYLLKKEYWKDVH
ncbi:cytochrome c1 [Alkalilimnicola ehrlichii]|uniref:Cytochrome c1 n=1 Tax=Alkalilimnicola ehrlichii TaxID=351052 RepID=A0A3E0WZR9_9GAMM|nr:cytochrome c1 [Alkalilimnicola ehrlichii]RFA30302.1 cytochrome c1 [Alkalilimnicola ehrlichii]RFA37879.1 cytochrome c1 [Alkalilimnicola ehrlichii]